MNIQNVFGVVCWFSLASMISMTLILANTSIANDYILYQTYTIADQLVNDSVLPLEARTAMEQINVGMLTFISNIDMLFMLTLAVFILSYLAMAYYAPRMGIFTFLQLSYIGIMFFLFIADIAEFTSNYIHDQVLINLIPTADQLMPWFAWYISNFGVITLILILIGLALNVLDLDRARWNFRKEKEVDALDEEL